MDTGTGVLRARRGFAPREWKGPVAMGLVTAMLVGGTYVWQHAQVSDRQTQLDLAVSARDAARDRAATLAGRVDDLQGRTGTLHERVELLQGKVGTLQGRVASLQGQVETLEAAPAVAPCVAGAMLPVIRDRIEIGIEGVAFETVDVQECRNGYARVFASIGQEPPGMHLEDSEQVFLKDEGGFWSVLTWGTGVDCTPPFAPPELEDACGALGLP